MHWALGSRKTAYRQDSLLPAARKASCKQTANVHRDASFIHYCAMPDQVSWTERKHSIPGHASMAILAMVSQVTNVFAGP